MGTRSCVAAVVLPGIVAITLTKVTAADEPAGVRVIVASCGAAAFDVDAFGRAATLELHVDGVERVEVLSDVPSAAATTGAPVATVRLELVPCTDQGREVIVHIVDEITSKTVERHLTIDDLPREVRARVLALAVAELLRASWVELRLPDAAKGAMPVPPSVRLAMVPAAAPAPAPPPSHFVRAGLALEGRFFPTFGSALVGPSGSVSLGAADRIPLRVHLGAKALFGTSYDPLGSVSVRLVAGGAAVVVAHRAGPIDVELGPRLEVGWGAVSGSAASATTVASSGTAPIVDTSAMLGLRLDLGGAFWATLVADVGGVLTGLDAQASGRRAAGFGGPVAGVALGAGRTF